MGELFDNALLKVPETEESLTLAQLEQGERFKDVGGVYTFFNEHGEPLYVGISNSLAKRVPAHIRAKAGNKDLYRYISSGKDVYVDVFYARDKQFQEVYESYLIHQLQPRFNVAKTGRVKV